MFNRFQLKRIAAGSLIPLVGFGTLAISSSEAALASGTTPVSTELMLAIDISGSVNTSEYNLQMDGYAAAFRDQQVIDAITLMPDGLAVGVVFWAQRPAAPVPWRVLKTEAEVRAFADYLDTLPRPSAWTQAVRPGNLSNWGDNIVGWATGIARGLRAATTSILNNEYDGEVLVIDISGDGTENVQGLGTLRSRRNAAVDADITVNGLPIESFSDNRVTNQYTDNVVGGDNGFVEVSEGFSDFTRAVKAKLQREITDTLDEFSLPVLSCPVMGDSFELTGTIRDFSDTHPDFQYRIGNDRDMVTTELGADRKPVYANPGGTTYTTNGKESFDQWYRDVPGVNQSKPYSITLTKQENGNYRYENTNFFPINDQMLMNEGRDKNFHFTYEIQTQFTYQGGEILNFSGDDDVWVYINGQRVVDLGGVHGKQNASVDVDAVAGQIGLEVGETYDFDFFFAERHTTQSNFILETSIVPLCDSDGDGISDIEESMPFGDPDGDGIVPLIDPIRGVPTQDIDGDGIPNWEDPDTDGDGVPDEIDPKPYDPNVAPTTRNFTNGGYVGTVISMNQLVQDPDLDLNTASNIADRLTLSIGSVDVVLDGVNDEEQVFYLYENSDGSIDSFGAENSSRSDDYIGKGEFITNLYNSETNVDFIFTAGSKPNTSPGYKVQYTTQDEQSPAVTRTMTIRVRPIED